MLFNFELFAENTAVETEQGLKLSYAELRRAAKSVIAKLDARKLTFCLCKNTIGSFVGYVGLMNANIPTVLLDASKDIDIIEDLIDHYQPQYVWCPTHRKAELSVGIPVCEYEDYTMLLVGKPDYEIHPDVLLCLTTSGTTGSPKLVKLTEKNLRSNADSIAEYLHITETERAITSLPMYYSFGMSVINSHLIKGATLLLTDKAVIQREFLNFLKSGKATSIGGVPYTYEILRRLRFLKMDLPELRTMIQAGEGVCGECTVNW